MESLKASPDVSGSMKIILAACLVLLAGCTASDSPATTTSGASSPGNGNGFAPQTGHAETTDPAAPGLKVTGDLRPCDGGFCIDAHADNAGPATYHASSICMPPWSAAMTHEGKDIQHEEGRAYCMAFGTSPLAPGASLQANFTWDQRVWNDGVASPAPEGFYTWTITFTAYDETMGEGVHRIPISFQVIVGET